MAIGAEGADGRDGTLRFGRTPSTPPGEPSPRTDGFSAAVGGDPAAFVDRVFTRVLGRAPDPAGRAYGVAQLDEGLPRAALGRAVADLDEVGARRVAAMARRLLARDPAPTEAAWWGAVLRAGTVVDLTTAIASQT